MHKPRFTDPLGSTLPALEQNILKYRAMEMVLVMFLCRGVEARGTRPHPDHR
jgi:hypothetical protein